MKARRFIVEAKSPSWRALPSNAFRLEHRGLNSFRNIAHQGPGTPAGGEEGSHGGKRAGGSHIAESRWDGLTSHRDQPIREAGGGGRCQLRSALTLADSLAVFELPSTGPGPLGCYSLGKLEAQQDVPTPLFWILNPSWQSSLATPPECK